MWVYLFAINMPSIGMEKEFNVTEICWKVWTGGQWQNHWKYSIWEKGSLVPSGRDKGLEECTGQLCPVLSSAWLTA